MITGYTVGPNGGQVGPNGSTVGPFLGVSVAGSGGLVYSGSASGSIAVVTSPASGGLIFAGAGITAPNLIYAYSGSGPIVFAGSSLIASVAANAGVGGLVFAGASGVVRISAVPGAGGIIFSGVGIAGKGVTAPLPTGGLLFAGAGLYEFRFIATYPGTGGITFSGAAIPVSINIWGALLNTDLVGQFLLGPDSLVPKAGRVGPFSRVQGLLGGLIFSGTAQVEMVIGNENFTGDAQARLVASPLVGTARGPAVLAGHVRSPEVPQVGSARRFFP